MNNTPSLKDLYVHITPLYATKWRVIGTLLVLPSETLDFIEHNYSGNAVLCCNEMLKKWLLMDITPSRAKLFTILESPVVSSTPDKGDY